MVCGVDVFDFSILFYFPFIFSQILHLGAQGEIQVSTSTQ